MPSAANTSTPSSFLAPLIEFGGVVWIAWIDTRLGSIMALHADGSSTTQETTERVLAEALFTAGDALGHRLGLGPAEENLQIHPGGGLLLRRATPQHLIAVRFTPGVPIARLRLLLRETVRQLAQLRRSQQTSSSAPPSPFGSFQPNSSLPPPAETRWSH